MTEGTRVTYRDVSLTDRGTVTRVERGARGGDLFVRWDRFPEFEAEECAFNLRPIERSAP